MLGWITYALTLATDPMFIDEFQAQAEIAHSTALEDIAADRDEWDDLSYGHCTR